jgi:hypothetical protein
MLEKLRKHSDDQLFVYPTYPAVTAITPPCWCPPAPGLHPPRPCCTPNAFYLLSERLTPSVILVVPLRPPKNGRYACTRGVGV